MAHGFSIEDGRGRKYRAAVDEGGRLATLLYPFPPAVGSLEQPMRVFRQHLTDDGLATDGSNQDMAVNGSVTNVDYYVGASDTADRYICRLSFVLADAGLVLNEFGNTGGTLANGCRLFYEDIAGKVDIHEALKSSFDFIRLCDDTQPIGATTTAFRASNVSGTSEAILPSMDLRENFGFYWGVKLTMGSTQRLVMRIRDDCSGVDQFDVIAYGFEMS